MDFKQYLIETSTLTMLDNSTDRAYPSNKRREQINAVKVLPEMSMTMKGDDLVVDSRTSSPSSGKIYNQRMVFQHVQPLSPEDGGVQLRGSNTFIEPIEPNHTKLRVNCNCSDFRFRFAEYNSQDDSLAGDPPPPYQRVAGSTRPPANPLRLPGMCKHLYAITQYLEQIGIIAS